MMKTTKIVTGRGHEATRSLIEDIMANGLPENATSCYNGKRNEIVRIETPYSDKPVNVKMFGNPKFPNNYVYTHLRKSKARRSFENAQKLLQMGFLTPEPLGYAEGHHGLRLTRSLYMSIHINCVPIRQWHKWFKTEQFIPQFAAEIARLHKAGVYFRDFSMGNILVDHTTTPGHYQFYYVDLNRTQFDVTNRHTLMQMFRCITSEEWALRELAQNYAKCMGQDEESIVAEALKVWNKFRRHHEIY